MERPAARMGVEARTRGTSLEVLVPLRRYFGWPHYEVELVYTFVDLSSSMRRYL